MSQRVEIQPTGRTFNIAIVKLLLLVIAQIPLLRAAPLRQSFTVFEEDEGKPPQDPTLWIYLAVAVGLVLLGGAFAGLTIALMGQDEIYLQVIKTSGEGAERKRAARVLRLLGRGKHWVLVTLLLSNVITNETLPIVLDRSLGGGWPAVLGSTVLIVIFGEIIPQSICVRYGLPIGAWMSPFVLVLMYVLGPVAWPTAKLLDWLLGADHGTVYKKAGLKTLVTLHKTLGAAGEQLNSDEVTIISAVLDLKEKPVGSIMTPMTDVFTMSADTVLDEKTMDKILSAGYSRIPIHAPGNKLNFVGMLLVKILITYDPEDCRAVRDFALATLPETAPETSCLDIVNFFQQGKSHMVLVSEYPGENRGAIGVVTLEDVIEELIGEEIIDESDVYVDVHKAIRRMTPAPRTRMPNKEVVEPNDSAGEPEDGRVQFHDELSSSPDARKTSVSNDRPQAKTWKSSHPIPHSPKVNLLRRLSGADGVYSDDTSPTRPNAPALRQRFSHLGPSNLASNPRSTSINAVKIKPGGGVVDSKPTTEPPTIAEYPTTGGVGEGLLDSAGKDAKDGVQAVQAGYGSFERPRTGKSSDTSNKAVQADSHTPNRLSPVRGRSGSPEGTDSTVGSLPSNRNSPYKSRNAKAARSGSITENVIESDGIKKVVLETTSSSEDARSSKSLTRPEDGKPEDSRAAKKKRRRKRRKDKRSGASENTPLLDEDSDGD